MKYIIETDRCLLRQMNYDDFDSLKQIISDPETMKYYRKPYDDEGVNKWIRWNLGCYEKRGFGLWAIILKETNEFIGDCGITLQNIDGDEVFEIGYHINKKYWRKCLASECAKACKEWFFNNTEYNDVYSYMNVNNLGSRGVAKNNGMTFIKEYDNDGEMDAVYRITKEEYLKSIMK